MKLKIIVVVLAVIFGCGCASLAQDESGQYVGQILPIAGILSDDPNFTITTDGDVYLNKGVHVPTYHGTSDIFLKEDGIFLGINDSARMFIDTVTPAPGDAWTFCTDNVTVKAMVLESETVLIDTTVGPVPGMFRVLADVTKFDFKQVTRPWLEANWGDRVVRFGADIHHYGPLLFEFHSSMDGVPIVCIDGNNHLTSIYGNVVIDPEDGGNWPGAKTRIVGDVEMAGGTLCFVDPNGGMVEGGMYGYNGGISLTSVAQGDWDKIAAFTANEPSNVIDPNHIDDHIHITKDGRYGCRWRWSGHGTAVAHDWEIMVFKDDGATAFTNTASKFTNPTTQKDITIPGGGKILCEAGDVIDIRVRRSSPGNNILFTTETCRLYVVQTGGL